MTEEEKEASHLWRFDTVLAFVAVVAVIAYMAWRLGDRARGQPVQMAIDHKALVNDENFHVLLGMAYGEAKLFDQAIFEEREALRVNPKSGMALNNLGWYSLEKGDYAGAARALEQALLLEPTSARVRNNLRVTYERGAAATATEEERKHYDERKEKLESGALVDLLKQSPPSP